MHPPSSPLLTRETGSGAAPEATNEVYRGVREALYSLGFDAGRFGTSHWNPLGGLVRPGQTVLLKPNLVVSEHEAGMRGLIATVANPSVIRALIDYAFIAVGPAGKIYIGDSPIKEVDFERICALSGLDATVEELQGRGVPVELCDFRDLRAFRDSDNTIVETTPLPGDPRGYVVYDLGADSLFGQLSEAECRRLRSTAAVYEDEASKHHTPTRNEYAIANSIISADLLISIAKLKSHRKSGITAALKNAIGTTNEKRWLPHHRVGTPSQGGDICPDEAPLGRKFGESWRQWANKSRHGKLARRLAKRPFLLASKLRRSLIGHAHNAADVGEGDWWGNDTIWRTTLDVNVLLQYGTRDGKVANERQRGYLTFIDAVLAGDGEGPLHPAPKEVGVLLASQDPVAADVVASRLAGFDVAKVPTVARAHEAGRNLGTNVEEHIQVATGAGMIAPQEVPSTGFEPSAGWKGHIELTEARTEQRIAA